MNFDKSAAAGCSRTVKCGFGLRCCCCWLVVPVSKLGGLELGGGEQLGGKSSYYQLG